MDLGELVAFVNTVDLESADDGLATPALLGAWVASRGRETEDEVAPSTYRRALDLREGLRALGRANNEEEAEGADLAALEAAIAELPLRASLGTGSQWSLTPLASGVDGYLAEIVATALRAMASGEWSRVKACQSDTCRWLFVDASRNRSRTWCAMAVCGSRMKSRAYRARRRAVA
jgi:predicted RNA-binding Zn ribbon-like protein